MFRPGAIPGGAMAPGAREGASGLVLAGTTRTEDDPEWDEKAAVSKLTERLPECHSENRPA